MIIGGTDEASTALFSPAADLSELCGYGRDDHLRVRVDEYHKGGEGKRPRDAVNRTEE